MLVASAKYTLKMQDGFLRPLWNRPSLYIEALVYIFFQLNKYSSIDSTRKSEATTGSNRKTVAETLDFSAIIHTDTCFFLFIAKRIWANRTDGRRVTCVAWPGHHPPIHGTRKRKNRAAADLTRQVWRTRSESGTRTAGASVSPPRVWRTSASSLRRAVPHLRGRARSGSIRRFFSLADSHRVTQHVPKHDAITSGHCKDVTRTHSDVLLVGSSPSKRRQHTRLLATLVVTAA